MRALIVDNSIVHQNILKQQLPNLGYDDLTFCNTGNSALHYLEMTRYDFLVTDLNLPGMDGITLVQEIRRTDPYIPILMITTKSRVEIVKKAIAAGINGLLLKPYSRDNLRTQINKIKFKIS